MATGPDSPPLPPLRREVIVRAPVGTAFAVFTGHIARWWPFGRFSVFGAGSSVAFEDGAIVERLGTQTSEWGRVSVWEPPHRISLSWHPGRDDEHATTVTVTFAEQDGATLVTLIHDDWQNHPSPEDGRRAHQDGWAYVLARYTERFGDDQDREGSLSSQQHQSHTMSSSFNGTAISVMLAVADAPAAVEWYRRALGATVLWDLGSVVGLEVDGAPVFLAEPAANGWATPDDVGLPTVRVEVFCDDPDAFVARALAAGGCRWHEELRDHEALWGVHRQGGFVDPFGHKWLVGDRSPLERHRPAT